MANKTALILRHLHFEDLGSFAAPIANAGYDIRYSDITDANFCKDDPLMSDLLVILGGPIGVYEDDIYPFVAIEREFIRRRLEENLPTLGICLGAQFIASALGADVYPSSRKEIGFSKIHLADEALAGPLRHLAGIDVLHWHGDTYDLPKGTRNLASTPLFSQQAFPKGANILGLQFHPEVETADRLEQWLVGHGAELSAAEIDRVALRKDGETFAASLRVAAVAMMTEWLEQLERDHG